MIHLFSGMIPRTYPNPNMIRTVLIATSSVNDMQKAVIRLHKLATKFQLSPLPSMNVKWETKATREKTVKATMLTGEPGDTIEQTLPDRVVSVDVVEADITLPDVEVLKAPGGWHLVGTLERCDNGTLEPYAMRPANLPKVTRYRDNRDMTCEHCRAKRVRNLTLVIENEAGETKQVGRECGDHYLTDLSRHLGALEFQAIVFDMIDARQTDDDCEFIGGWGRGRIYRTFEVDYVLGLVSASCRKHGFQKAWIRSDFGELLRNPASTKDAVLRHIEGRPVEPKPLRDSKPLTESEKMVLDGWKAMTQEDRDAEGFAAFHEMEMLMNRQLNAYEFSKEMEGYQRRLSEWTADEPTDEDKAKAEELIKWIEAQPDSDEAESGDYMGLLKDSVRVGFVSEKRLGAFAAVLETKAMADRKARLAEMLANRSEPAPEGRVVISGEVIKLKEKESDFGTVWKVIVQTDNGCRVYVTAPDGQYTKIGSRVNVVATFTRSTEDQFFAFGSRPIYMDDAKAEAERVKLAKKAEREAKKAAKVAAQGELADGEKF